MHLISHTLCAESGDRMDGSAICFDLDKIFPHAEMISFIKEFKHV